MKASRSDREQRSESRVPTKVLLWRGPPQAGRRGARPEAARTRPGPQARACPGPDPGITARLCRAAFAASAAERPLFVCGALPLGRQTLAAVKDDPDLLALGREARCLREALDLTQEELADRAGLHPNSIGRIERGESNVGVKALFKLARGLGVSPAALFDR